MVGVLCIIGIILVGRLFQLQVIQHGEWLATASSIQERTIEVAARRAAIYDRYGAPLAFDVKASAIAIDSFNMTKPETLTAILHEELGESTETLKDLIYRPSYFTCINRKVDLATAQAIKKRVQQETADGLIFIDTWKRCYPQGSLASNVIGFVGMDGEGLAGIEYAYDEVLSGSPAVLHVIRGADGRTYHTETIAEGEAGQDIYLTIDSRLQFACEEALDSGVVRYIANKGLFVLMDPQSGDVLAMAQDCRYDLNRFYESTAQERLNLAIGFIFEPGSSFKAFSGLAALDCGVVDVDDTFNGNDGVLVAGHTMHNAEFRSFGTVTFADIIRNSINTGMVRVTERLGDENLYRFLVDAGFGRKTEVGLPGEEKGILRDVNDWSRLALAATSIGQSVGVTGIQLARAMSVIANGGLLLEPRIIQGFGQDGTAPREAEVLGRIASAEGCETMRGLLRKVIESGTGTPVELEGYDIAGKTGTAQKAIPGEGYVDGKYTSIFAGFFPVEKPEYLGVVVLDEVKTNPVWGGYTCGPIFKEAVTDLVTIEQLPPVALK